MIRNRIPTELTPDDITELKKRLLQELKNAQGTSKVAISGISNRSNTFGDHMSDCCHEDNTQVSIILGQKGKIGQINASLRRIEQGDYGICVQCKKPIGRERLKAKPHARLCISCREVRENGGR